ncbi:MAG: class I SAM-dependent methyltransferase [Bacteroidota bacterium]
MSLSPYQQSIQDLHRADLYLHFYEELITDEITRKQCTYIEKHAGITGPVSILDLACGHGRHSRYWAGQGHEVTGIDLNAAFIDLARKEAEKQQMAASFQQGDILDLSLQSSFDLAVLLFNSLGFFTETEILTLLAKVEASLKPGGYFCLDIQNRDRLLAGLQPTYLSEKGEDLMIDRISFDPISGTTTNQRTYLKDGQRFETPFTMYAYHYGDLKRMLKDSGFTVEKVLGGWQDEPFDHKARRIFLMLKKQ